MNNGWTPIFLAVIAFAALVMAIVQVGLILVASRLAARVERLTRLVEGEIKPLIGKFTEVGENAARASALAVAQVERADRLFADMAHRVDDTMAMVQHAIVAPAREGRAVMAAVRATAAALRQLRAARARHEDEDALFIG